MKIDMNKTSKFVLMMPDVALLDEVLNQKVEFFNAGEFINKGASNKLIIN